MTDIQITIDSTQIDALLNGLIQKSSNLQPVMGAIGHSVAEHIRLCFRDTRSPNGQPWKPLSPVTIGRRRQHSSVPLNDTGRLRNSITYLVLGDNSVEVGTDVKYAAVMNFGAKKGAFGKTRRNSPIPWGNIPARQFIPEQHLPSDWEAEVMNIVKRYFSV